MKIEQKTDISKKDSLPTSEQGGTKPKPELVVITQSINHEAFIPDHAHSGHRHSGSDVFYKSPHRKTEIPRH